MKKTLGNLLLIAGVIVSSLAAGESQRVSRAAPVDGDLVGEVLHTPVTSSLEEQQPELRVLLDRTLASGHELVAEDVDWLASCGVDEVLILRRARDSQTLPVDEGAVGKVLAEPVVLGQEVDQIPAGRLITADFVERIEQAGLSEVAVNVALPDGQGGLRREELRWSFAEGAENPEEVELVGNKLSEAISLPVQLRQASYVDAEVLERLRASQVEEISVKIPRSWTWQSWGSRWVFVIGIAITVLGVLLKRARPDAQELEAGALEVARLGELLSELEGAVELLAGRIEKLDAEAIHHEVDPLLLGPVYAIANGRESIRGAHGGRVFAAVMDAFARGERKLNRAWSAAVDGHAPEARVSLMAALPALREAREALPGTQAPRPAGFDSAERGAPLPPDVPLAGGRDPWDDET